MGVRIQFNGREYASVGEMPEDERRRYELLMQQVQALLPEANASDVTSSMEASDPKGAPPMIRSRIVVKKRTFESPEELPPELRREYDEAMNKAKTGTPRSHASFTVSVVTRGSANRDPRSADSFESSAPPAPNDPGAIRGESTARRVLLAITSSIAIAAVAWFLFGPRLAGR